MFKLIIKNLWSRRKRNGWLLAELILVTVVAWVIIDPLVMAVVVKTTPYGYDTDRLVDISMDSYSYGMSGYDESQTDSASLAENAMRIYNRLKSYPQIESVTRKTYTGLGGQAIRQIHSRSTLCTSCHAQFHSHAEITISLPMASSRCRAVRRPRSFQQ